MKLIAYSQVLELNQSISRDTNYSCFTPEQTRTIVQWHSDAQYSDSLVNVYSYATDTLARLVVEKDRQISLQQKYITNIRNQYDLANDQTANYKHEIEIKDKAIRRLKFHRFLLIAITGLAAGFAIVN